MDRRRKRRVAAVLPVRVWGVDAKAQPFAQSAKATNISSSGALVAGLSCRLKPGELIHVQCEGEQAQFRIVWVGKAGSDRDREIGIEVLPSEPSIWDVNFAHCAEFVGKG